MSIRFGTAGTPDNFKSMGFKGTIDVPDYIEKIGLNAFEYQCGQGVRIGEDLAKKFGEKSIKKDISLSIHAPYFISLSSIDEEKRDKSIQYILQTAIAANNMGAKRIIVHSGSCSKISRDEALTLAKATLQRAYEALCEKSLAHITICPETMGKINQLGTLSEVLELCKVSESFIPCIDFGHLNARSCGQVNTKDAFSKILDDIENQLGIDRLKVFHSHFSKIMYTEKGGEVKHLTFDDEKYGPDFEPLIELIAKKNLEPTIICESSGTQGDDAKTMQDYYNLCQKK